MSAPSPARSAFMIGMILPFVTIAFFLIEFLVMRRMAVPWYGPIVTTVSLGLIAFALAQHRSKGRIAGMLLIFLLTVFQWGGVIGYILPEYEGPQAIGQPLVSFEAKFADGTEVTSESLLGQKTILILFRGRL